MAGRCPYYPNTYNAAQGNSSGGDDGGDPNRPWHADPSLTSTICAPTTPTVHRPPTLIRLEQHQYGHVVPGHVVEFGTLNGEPVNLLDALNNKLQNLENKSEPAFFSYMDVKAKASIRIQISGIASYTRQFMSLRSDRKATSISRGKLVQTIAKEVKKMMKGDVLRVPGVGDFPMEEIYLTKIRAYRPFPEGRPSCPAGGFVVEFYFTAKEENNSDSDGPAALCEVNICERLVLHRHGFAFRFP